LPPMIRIYVIGMGFKPFDNRTIELIHNAQVIFASARLFDAFKQYGVFERVKDRTRVIEDVYETMESIRTALNSGLLSPIVLLAAGDPMFSGIGSMTVREFGKEIVEVLPDLSSIQVAFSRIKEPWDDAFFLSLHGGPNPKKRRRLHYGIDDIPALLLRHQRIALLTDKINNPSAIAKVLPPEATMAVFEKLGYPDERITEGAGEEVSGMTFVNPNLVIIKVPAKEGQGTRDTDGPSGIRFGLKESEIAHPRGLITKDEVRAVTIHKLRLPQKGIFWDIGAGSGSVSFEAASLCPGLLVFAVEKETEQIRYLRENKIRFNLLNTSIVEGSAPEALRDLPSPERVFIGGSGGRLKEIIDFIAQTKVGHVVLNATTLETLHEAMECLENKGFKTEASEVSISRTKTIAGKRHMSALNPVFIISGERRP
jgi:precorrin-6B C5,15-methyltransferase / cobalt-precorrin-6B C5,C15-methyltransferase